MPRRHTSKGCFSRSCEYLLASSSQSFAFPLMRFTLLKGLRSKIAFFRKFLKLALWFGSMPTYSSMWNAFMRDQSMPSASRRAANVSFWDGAAANMTLISSLNDKSSLITTAASLPAQSPISFLVSNAFTTSLSLPNSFNNAISTPLYFSFRPMSLSITMAQR